jgi:GTP-binding protein HflX
LVINKIDAMDTVERTHLRAQLPEAEFVSAHTGQGLDRLRDRIGELLAGLDVEVNVLVPYTRGDLLARIHADGRILESSHEQEGTRVRASVPRSLAPVLSQFAGSRG